MRKSKLLSFFLLMLLICTLSFSVYANDSMIYGTFYEIFVRSFYDSNGDGIGDLQGIIEKIDYLNDGDSTTTTDLGIRGIWLMPILESPSYHGYDVTNYYKINSDYGNVEDLKELIQEAHKRGIKVIMDLPLNHTARSHPWFKSASLYKESKYRDYYVWADENTNTNERRSDGAPVWHKTLTGEYYAYFWEGMPDLNYNNPKVRSKMIDIAQYWLKQGIDGFRLDGAMHIFPPKEYNKNFEWWDEFSLGLASIKPDVYLVGEVWSRVDTIAPYYNHGFDSAFNFNAARQIIKNVQSGFSFGFNGTLDNIYNTYDKTTGGKYIDAPFLTNHDQNRAMSQLNGDWNKARIAASIYLTLPGNPFIYYGEEIGMKGTKPDEAIREPMQWYEGDGEGETTWEYGFNNDGFTSVESQEKEASSLLNHYRSLIHLRNKNPIFYGGGIKFINGGANLLAYIRYNDKKELYIYHNISKYEQKIKVDKGIEWQVLFSSSKISAPNIEEGKLVFTLLPYTTLILEKK